MALGANLGDPLAQLRRAAAELGRLGELRARSAIYETAPVGGPAGQPPYLNAVVSLRPGDAHRDPHALLSALLAVERRLGRERRERWGPRLIDLDLLDYGGRVSASAGPPALELPHPRLADRPFVLAPLCDLDPEWRHPTSGRSACELLRGLDLSGVRRTELAW